VPKQHVEVVYNGVPSRETPTEKPSIENVTAMFVGVVREDKRVDLLIQALAQIADRAPNLRLSVVGAGPTENRLRSLARCLGVDHKIAWEGWQLNTLQYLDRASFLVLCSDPGVETLSMAVLEAMANGLPVICTDVGSMGEVVDSTVGCLVPPGDPGSLANAMLELYRDETLRNRKGLAAAARQRERFSSERLAAQMERIILEEALKGSSFDE
jgi:glycosyltransferase involved in cell wall biosynthesis